MSDIEQKVQNLNREFRSDSGAVHKAFVQGESDPSDDVASAYRRYAEDLRKMLRLCKQEGASRNIEKRVELLMKAAESVADAYDAPDGQEADALRKAEKALKAWKRAQRD